jgi:hypothetical protein
VSGYDLVQNNRKEAENHAHAVSLFFLYYNYCRSHQALTKGGEWHQDDPRDSGGPHRQGVDGERHRSPDGPPDGPYWLARALLARARVWRMSPPATPPNNEKAVLSTSLELRPRVARLVYRWANWWRIVREWRGLPVLQRFLAICSYCGRVRLPGGTWEQIPPAVTRRLHADAGPQLTHGICPDCFAKLDRSAPSA